MKMVELLVGKFVLASFEKGVYIVAVVQHVILKSQNDVRIEIIILEGKEMGRAFGKTYSIERLASSDVFLTQEDAEVEIGERSKVKKVEEKND